MRKLFRTVCEHKLCISIFTVIIVIIFLLLYIATSLSNLASHNGSDVAMLGTSMRFESGPDFKRAIEDSKKILEEYMNYMEDRYLADTLRIFCSEYSPKKGLGRALNTLKNAEGSQEDFAKSIWLAGEQVEQYRMKAETFPIFKLALHKYQKVPCELVVDIEDALENSQKSLADHEKNPTLENAVRSCEDNRRTMLLLFLARAGYNSGHNELFDKFQEIVKAAKESKIKRAAELSDGDPEKRFLIEIICESEQRRSEILDFLKTDNMDKALTLMWESIEKAYHLRPIILELSSKVGYGESWQKRNETGS